MKRKLENAILFAATILLLGVLSLLVNVSEAKAQVVSLTFDDGFRSTYTNALPVLSSRNMKATVYVTPGLIDQGFIEAGLPAMTWTQIKSLQNDYGWEIGGHSYSHAELPTLTTEQIIQELTLSTEILKNYGLAVSNFASPYGAYDNRVLEEALKLYDSHRGFWDRQSLNSNPYDRDVLMVKSVESSTSVSTVKGWIDNAVTNRKWLILVFHDVQTNLNRNYSYTTKTSDLANIANYLKNKNVPVKTVSQVLAKPGVNLLENSNFANGLSGWSTDTPSQVTIDYSNHGAHPNPSDSIKFAGSSANAHLYSAMVNISTSGNFIVESFYNTINLPSGELGYYIDEYDSSGIWISGKWIGSVPVNSVGYFAKSYTSTSVAVGILEPVGESVPLVF